MIFKKPTKLSPYESNIDPMLRAIHHMNIDPCSWVKVKKAKRG